MKSLIIFVFLISLGFSNAVYKKWTRNTSLGNAGNWNAGRPPCGNDRVVIHDESAAVFVQMDTTIKELTLPMNGEVVFGDNSIIAFTDSPDHSASCTPYNGVVEFNVTYPRDWFDTRNWCQTASETGNCQSVGALDSEQIPCQSDDVVFPKGNSFFVNLDSGAEITVNTFKITEKAYTTSTLRTFLDTNAGKHMFPVPTTGSRSTITVQRRPCNDPTGCSCGNDKQEVLSRICKIKSPFCERAKCRTPLRPAGTCCDICGAVLRLDYGTGFKFSTLRDGLRRNVLDKTGDFNDVVFIVSKLTTGQIQIVVSDNTGDKGTKAGNALYTEIRNDVTNGGFKYSINKVTIETSAGGGSRGPTSGKQVSHGEQMPGGEIAGIVVGIGVVFIIILVAVFFMYRRKSKSNTDDLGFRVFDKITFKKPNFRKPRVEVPPSFGFRFGETPETVRPTSQGFDNPMYGNNPLENEKPMDIEMVPTSVFGDEQPTFDGYDSTRGFDNPLYDTASHQESLFADPTAVQEEGGKVEVDVSLPTKGTDSPGQSPTTVVISPIIPE